MVGILFSNSGFPCWMIKEQAFFFSLFSIFIWCITYQAGKKDFFSKVVPNISLIVTNFDNYMIFFPIFSTKLKRKKNQRMKKKMMKMRMLLIKRKTFQMIQWQVWLIYRGVPLNKTAPYEMSHPLLFKVIYDRIWKREKIFWNCHLFEFQTRNWKNTSQLANVTLLWIFPLLIMPNSIAMPERQEF